MTSLANDARALADRIEALERVRNHALMLANMLTEGGTAEIDSEIRETAYMLLDRINHV